MTDLDALLARWAAWMRVDDTRLGYPRKAAVVASGAGSQSFDELCAVHLDTPEIEATDAAIRSLGRAQEAAIHSVWLRARWQHKAPLLVAYELALAALEIELHKRGIG